MTPVDAGAVQLVAVAAGLAVPLASVVRHAIGQIAVSRRIDRCLDVYERLRTPGSDAASDISRIVRSLGDDPGTGTPLPTD